MLHFSSTRGTSNCSNATVLNCVQICAVPDETVLWMQILTFASYFALKTSHTICCHSGKTRCGCKVMKARKERVVGLNNQMCPVQLGAFFQCKVAHMLVWLLKNREMNGADMTVCWGWHQCFTSLFCWSSVWLFAFFSSLTHHWRVHDHIKRWIRIR